MAEAPTRFFLQEIATRVGPLALVTMDNGEDWQKPNVFGRAALESLRRPAARACRTSAGEGLVLTGKPFVFAAGADLDEFPLDEHARAGARRRARRATTRFGGDPRPARTRRSPRSTAPRSAAASRSRSTATSARSPARCVTSASPRSSSGSSRRGAARSSLPRLVGAAAAVELIVANPLKQNRLTARRPGGRARPRRRAARRRRVPRRLDRVARARDRGGTRRRVPTPISPTRPRSARRRATPSTTPCTASRSRPTARST